MVRVYRCKVGGDAAPYLPSSNPPPVNQDDLMGVDSDDDDEVRVVGIVGGMTRGVAIAGCSKSMGLNNNSRNQEAGPSNSLMNRWGAACRLEEVGVVADNRETVELNDIDVDNGEGEGGDGDDGDVNGFKWPSNLPHPLLIPDVVRDIFDKLGMQDIDRLRQVGRVWNEEACAVLQEKKLVALLEIDSMKYYLEKMSTTPYFPHQNFELHMENLLEPQVMRRFWTTFGTHIKFLDFRQSSLFIETLLDIMAQHLPNLERLAIKSLPRKMTLRRNSHPPLHFVMYPNQNQNHAHAQPVPRDDWTLLRFPHVKELTLCWCPQDEDATINILKDLLRSLPCLEGLLVTDIPPLNVGPGPDVPQPHAVGTRTRVARLLVQALTDASMSLPHLSIINFPIDVGNSELTKLTEKRYQFKTLNLKLNNGTKSSYLKEFLTSVSSTLRSLEIIFQDGFFSDGATFPAYSQMKHPEQVYHLQEVRHLTLKNFVGPLELLQNLIKIKTLTINSAKFDSIYGFVKLHGVTTNEHQLQCLKTDSFINPSAIVSLSTSFPLLRVIKMLGIDDNGLGVIYRNLPYISELEIIKGKITDQGLSGVPLEVCKDMAETSTFLFVDPSKFRSDLFLGSLQYLKTLKLVCDDVSDISIVFGMVDCKNLESLSLHSPSISDLGLFKIADMMSQLHYLDVHECENVSEEGKFYVKEKMQHVPTLILEPYSLQKRKSTDNAFRQIGFPYRGRCVRPERYGPDDEYDRLPLRERMLMEMDRRRRYIALRMIHRVGRVPQGVAAAAAALPEPLGNPPNDEELRMLMEMHPMFAEDEIFMNFGDEANNLPPGAAELTDSDEDEDIPTPPNEIEIENEEVENIPMHDPYGIEDEQEHDPPEAMQQEFAVLLNQGMLFPLRVEPEFDENGAD